MGQMDGVVESASLAGPLLEPFAESPRGSGTLNHTRGGAWPSLAGTASRHRRYRTQVLAGRFVSVPDSDKCLEPPDGTTFGGARLGCFLVRVCLTFNSLQSLTLLTNSNQAFTRQEFRASGVGSLVSWGMGGQAPLSHHSAMTARA